MGWADNIRRQAHRVDFDGNAFFVRALTAREFKAVGELSDDEKDEQMLKFGVCDEVGRPVIDPGEDLSGVPLSIRHGLIVEIMEKSVPTKKALIRSIANSGDLASGGESPSGNLNQVSGPTN